MVEKYISRKDAIDAVRACCLEANACNLQCIKDIPPPMCGPWFAAKIAFMLTLTGWKSNAPNTAGKQTGLVKTQPIRNSIAKNGTVRTRRERGENMGKFEAIIICGFPGIGKTTAEQRCRQAIDCESSGFQHKFDPTEVNAGSPAGVYKENRNWVKEYVDKLVELAMDVRYHYVFASTHLEVREELDARSVPYIVVAPERSLKDEYLSRYVRRGDSAEFIIRIFDHWDEWLEEIEKNAPAVIHLKAGQVLADFLPIPQLRN